MKIKLLMILAISIIIVSCSSGISKNSEKNESVVKEIENILQEYTIPTECKFYEQEDTYFEGIQKFYPIGWSENSKFAYFKIDYDYAAFENSEPIIYTLIVQDLITDKNISETKYSKLTEKTTEIQQNFTEIWNNNYSDLKKILNENGIIQQQKFSFSETISNYEFIKEPITDTYFANYYLSNGNGKKLIIKSEDGEISGVHNVFQLMAKSPYEERVAILNVKICTMSSNTLEYSIIGSSLTENFK